MNALLLEQTLNALQFGLMLYLLSSGLTLVFGIMGLINLAHGSLYMIGGFLAVVFVKLTGSFAIGVPLSLVATAALAMLLETVLLRRFYSRDHLSQVLCTFGIILVANDGVRFLFGSSPLMLALPPALEQPVTLFDGFSYPRYRFMVIGVGIAVALGLSLLIDRTRIGMWIRAGASNREMARAMGVDIGRLYTLVFGLGAVLCALAGALLGPLLSVTVGMGESIIILSFVIVIIGGLGSIRGALIGSLAIGALDTFGRAFLPGWMQRHWPSLSSDTMAPAAAAMLTYALMVGVLCWRPQGLFGKAS